MSFKNKKITSLKIFDCVQISYNDATGPTYFFAKIDLDSLESIPYDLDLTTAKEVLLHYWFPLNDIILMFWNIFFKCCSIMEQASNKTLNELHQQDPEYLTLTLTSFLIQSLKLWSSLPPLLQDLNILYRKHDKVLGELEFTLLDFWFHNLSVINELMQVFEEFQLNIAFPKPKHSDLFQFTLNDVILHEPTELNLKSITKLNWNTYDFVGYLYFHCSKIDVDVFNEWLVSRKIKNEYESKEKFVFNYLINLETGLGSLSMSTLKLLAINPILDFASLRKIHDEKNRLSAEKWAKIHLLPAEEQQQARIANMLVMANDNIGKSPDSDD